MNASKSTAHTPSISGLGHTYGDVFRAREVAQISNLLYRRLPAGRASEYPRASASPTAADLEIAIQQTEVCATHQNDHAMGHSSPSDSRARRATPSPVLGSGAEPGGHRIWRMYRDNGHVHRRREPSGQTVPAAKSGPRQPQRSFGPQGRELFPTLNNVSHQMIRHRHSST